MEQYIGFVIVLFLLSMICERVADFLKNYLSEENDGWGKAIKKLLRIGNLLKKGEKGSVEESKRYYRILKINILCGFFTAWALHADLFSIVEHKENPFDAIGWNNVTWFFDKSWNGEGAFINGIIFIVGCFGTGFFISFGSKFWHDLLDILLEVKNYRRILADPGTYQIDNIKSFDKVIATYQSDFAKAAYLEAQPKYMAMPNVKAFSLKIDDNGYYFDITLKQADPGIGSFYQYLLDNGTPQNIRISIKIMDPGDEIIAHTFDLSAKIFDDNQPDIFGTLGCLVKPLDNASKKRYILTCCHNVVVPISGLSNFKPNVIQAGVAEADSNPVGNVVDAYRDHEIDAALILLNEGVFETIDNEVPEMGTPKLPRTLKSKDKNITRAFIYGAKSMGKDQEGIVTSIYSAAEITYSGDHFQINNLLAISNNNKAVSKRGDSGSIVLDEDNNALGLVVAGSSKETYVIPIEKILTKFKVQLA